MYHSHSRRFATLSVSLARSSSSLVQGFGFHVRVSGFGFRVEGSSLGLLRVTHVPSRSRAPEESSCESAHPTVAVSLANATSSPSRSAISVLASDDDTSNGAATSGAVRSGCNRARCTKGRWEIFPGSAAKLGTWRVLRLEVWARLGSSEEEEGLKAEARHARVGIRRRRSRFALGVILG